MTAAVVEISSRQAQQLWGKLQQHFINAERILEEIIEKRAWEPMGYESFSEAWTAQMADITIATEIRPHVVYQMLTEGASADEIAGAVKGVGPERVESLSRQKRNGVPPGDASLTVVREHLRKPPSAPDTLHIRIGVMRYKRYKRIAERWDKTIEEIAHEAIEAHFRDLSDG